MKKIYATLVAAAVLTAWIPALVLADPVTDEERNKDEFIQILENVSNDTQILENPSSDTPDVASDDGRLEYVKVRGIWGHAGDNESDGYFGGKITRRERVAVFKGVYNETGNKNRTQIIGIMKRGYFNGKIVTEDGQYRITGLYKVENNLLKLRWTTAHANGWAVARIILPG